MTRSFFFAWRLRTFLWEDEKKDNILPDPLRAEELSGRGDGREFGEAETSCDFKEETNFLLDPLPVEDLSGRRDSKEFWVICDFKEKMEGHVAERDLNSKTQDAGQPTMGASKDSKE